ncbi:MAG: TIGR03557 family F420-dependent LLM class oxidoreductase [Candidatus Bathyarchaeia archaeon]
MELRFGLFAAHEQYDPNSLLNHVLLAEKYDFDTIWTSDHFHPWTHTNAHSGFAWVWIATALEKTKRLKIGTGVTAPILRYHPAIIAQAFATLGFLYPNRIFLGLGTGEPMNEIPLGYGWPNYKERYDRLEEAIKIIRMLWTKDFVSFKGNYFKLRNANLYTKPKVPIPLYVAACGSNTAYLAGKYADGFLTLPAVREKYRELFLAIEKGARDSGRDPSSIEKVIEIEISYDQDIDKALESAKFWSGILLADLLNLAKIYDPREIENYGNITSDKALKNVWFITSSIDEILSEVENYIKLGFTHIQFLSSSPSQEKFIKTIGEKVIPYLREVYRNA